MLASGLDVFLNKGELTELVHTLQKPIELELKSPKGDTDTIRAIAGHLKLLRRDLKMAPKQLENDLQIRIALLEDPLDFLLFNPGIDCVAADGIFRAQLLNYLRDMGWAHFGITINKERSGLCYAMVLKDADGKEILGMDSTSISIDYRNDRSVYKAVHEFMVSILERKGFAGLVKGTSGFDHSTQWATSEGFRRKTGRLMKEHSIPAGLMLEGKQYNDFKLTISRKVRHQRCTFFDLTETVKPAHVVAVVRRARTDDVRAIARIESIAFIPELQEGADIYRKIMDVNPEGCFVATVEEEGRERVVGYAFAIRIDDPEMAKDPNLEPSDHSKNGRYAYLWSIASDPDYKGASIGELLLTKMESEEDAAESVLCITYPTLRKFYERQGYEVLEVMEDFYRDGREGLLLTKWLKKPL